MNPKPWYRGLGAGALLLHLYHRPMNRLRNVLGQGGPMAMRETERHRAQMEAAAASLPPLPEPAADSPLRLQMLTGKRFWYQTAFCLHSFVRAAGVPVRIDVYDDGSLTGEPLELLSRLGPALQIHSQRDTIDRLDELLPAARFPTLRETWKTYVPLRKLTDIHVGGRGWKLFIDSDLLFFRPPTFLLDWMRAPEVPLHAVDCMESYGYTRALLERLAKGPLPNMLNTGLCGLRSEDIDWDQLEAWCTELIERERPQYFLEQAVVALMSSGYPRRVFAPADDYITLPNRAEVEQPRAVMHHYVANSKRWYFRYGWRHAMAPG